MPLLYATQQQGKNEKRKQHVVCDHPANSMVGNGHNGYENGASRLPFLTHLLGGKSIGRGDPLLTTILLLLMISVTAMERAWI